MLNYINSLLLENNHHSEDEHWRVEIDTNNVYEQPQKLSKQSVRIFSTVLYNKRESNHPLSLTSKYSTVVQRVPPRWRRGRASHAGDRGSIPGRDRPKS